MNEDRNLRAGKHIMFGVKLAAVIVGSSLLLALARKQGLIDEDMVVRAFNVIMGLSLAAYGNLMPKMMDGPPPQSIDDATLKQTVARVSSWAMTLAFLVWAALWAFAPHGLAKIGSIVAVVGSITIVLGYLAWTCAAQQPRKNVGQP